MIRALAALLGFAAAAALLAVAPQAGDLTGRDLWYVAGVWAAAGLVAGILYQSGGVRRPGIRANPWLFLLVFAPWTIVATGVIAQTAIPGSTWARWMRDATPDTLLSHWVVATSVFAFGAGLLLAFSFIEPLVGTREVVTEERTVSRAVPVAPATPATTPLRPAGETTEREQALDTRSRARIVEESSAADAGEEVRVVRLSDEDETVVRERPPSEQTGSVRGPDAR